MKYLLRIASLLAITQFSQFSSALAQTTIIDPLAEGGFELGTTFEANGWTLVNYSPGTGNNWRMTTTDLSNGAHSFARTGNRAAFISQHSSGTTWTYKINEYSTTHFYRDVTFPAGEEIINLDFRWKAQGEGTSTAAYDVLYVYLCPPTLTPVTHSPYGTSSAPLLWTGTGDATLIGSFHSNPSLSGTVASVTLPASLAGTNQRLVFTWKNGNTLGVQPPAAVDSISLRSDCHKPNLFLTNTTIPCSPDITINSTVHFGSASGTYHWYINDVLYPSVTTSNFTHSALSIGDEITCIYQSNNACDYSDTATIVLAFGTNTTSTDTLVLCSSELPYTWNAHIIPNTLSSGVYPNYRQVSYPKADGCDSIVRLHLTIRNTPAPKVETISTCRALLEGMTWRGIDIPLDAASNSRYDSLLVSNPVGCDSLIYLNLQIIDSTIKEVNVIEDCYAVIFRGKRYTDNAIIVDTFRNLGGCDSLYVFNEIKIDDFDIELLLEDSMIIEHSPATIHVEGNQMYYDVLSWSPSDIFTNQNARIQDFIAPLTLDVVVTAMNPLGCLDTATLKINAIKFEKDVIMPTAFSPNGDGLNDVFKPVFAMTPNLHKVQMSIFDRWGNRVFHHATGDNQMGWDGMMNGTIVPAGVYYYIIDISYLDRTDVTLKGDVTLIR